MRGERPSWLLEMWKIKLHSWREAARIHARSGAALLLSLLFPARVMRGLDKRLAAAKRAREEEVLRRADMWFTFLDRLGLRPSCLVRSLTLACVLREEGHDANLVFSVRGDNGDMEGHCWVAVGGRALT